MKSIALLIFLLSNIGIIAGYMFLAFKVVPKAAARMIRTKVGGMVFFFTCGLTHVELLIHSLTPGGLSTSDFLSYHMLLIHVVQVVSVWMFVTGLYMEFVRWGPWRAAHEVPITAMVGKPDDGSIPPPL